MSNETAYAKIWKGIVTEAVIKDIFIEFPGNNVINEELLDELEGGVASFGRVYENPNLIKFITSGRDILDDNEAYILAELNDGKNTLVCFDKETSRLFQFQSHSKYHGINDDNNIGHEYNHTRPRDFITDIVSSNNMVFVNRGYIPEANGVKYSTSFTNNSYTYGFAFVDTNDVLFIMPYGDPCLRKVVFNESPLTKAEFFSINTNDEETSVKFSDKSEH